MRWIIVLCFFLFLAAGCHFPETITKGDTVQIHKMETSRLFVKPHRLRFYLIPRKLNLKLTIDGKVFIFTKFEVPIGTCKYYLISVFKFRKLHLTVLKLCRSEEFADQLIDRKQL